GRSSARRAVPFPAFRRDPSLGITSWTCRAKLFQSTPLLPGEKLSWGGGSGGRVYECSSVGEDATPVAHRRVTCLTSSPRKSEPRDGERQRLGLAGDAEHVEHQPRRSAAQQRGKEPEFRHGAGDSLLHVGDPAAVDQV